MYTSGCTSCPSQTLPSPLLYWAPAPGRDDSAMLAPLATPALGHPYQLAYSEALKRTSFFIADLLHPSVIPLPGTLTAQPGAVVQPRGPLGPRGPRPLPPVRSQDLKFGIDRILTSGQAATESTGSDRCRRSPSDDVRSSPSPSSSAAASPPPSSGPTGFPPCPCVTSSPLSLPGFRCISHGRLEPDSAGTGRLMSPPTSHPLHFVHPFSKPLPTYAQHRLSEFPGRFYPYPSGLLQWHGDDCPSTSEATPKNIGPYAVLSSDSSSGAPSDRHPQSGPGTSKRKRSWSRAVFSHLQRKGLEKRFEVQKYVTKPDRKQLAAMLGLTDAQVKVWFQNRRMKWRHAEEAKRQAKQDDTSSGDHPENQDENPDIDVSALEDPDDSDHVDPCTLDDEEEEMEERELQIMEMKNQEENATKPLTETLCAESEVS